MKKLLVILLAALVLCGCSSTDDPNEDPNGGQKDPVVNAEITVSKQENEEGKTYTFSRMPANASDLEALDLSDEYQAACAIIFTLARYEASPDDCYDMFEYINGPEDMSAYDKSFIVSQMGQYPYVMRSYIDGTSPSNSYEVDSGDEVSITLKENPYSRDEEGYVVLWLHSSGADSDRSVKLRLKSSTNQWFLFSDTYKGLMAGIRQPSADDKWN